MKRKVLLLLMVVVFLMGMISPAYGWWGSWGGSSPSSEEYDLVSLGDSTAVGTRPLSLTSFPVPSPYVPPGYPIYPEEIYFAGGYFELLAWNHFEDDAVTHAVDGKDSRDILRDLWRNRTLRNDVRNAEEAIILCVGGNDLLGRVIDAALVLGGQLYNADPTNYPKPPVDPDYTAKLYYFNELAEAIVKQGIVTGNPNALYDALETILADAKLMEGVIGFGLRYPSIIRTMTRLNDDAEIYVLNVFNPIPTDAKGMEEIRGQLEVLLGLMNKVIAKNANRYENVHLIDVHSAFASDPDTTSFNPFAGSLDPHPTDEGQELIYDLIVEKMEEVDD